MENLYSKIWTKSFNLVADASLQVAQTVNKKLVTEINKKKERNFRQLTSVMERVAFSIKTDCGKKIKLL